MGYLDRHRDTCPVPKEWREAHGYRYSNWRWMNATEKRSLIQTHEYEQLMGRMPPAPLPYPEWTLAYQPTKLKDALHAGLFSVRQPQEQGELIAA